MQVIHICLPPIHSTWHIKLLGASGSSPFPCLAPAPLRYGSSLSSACSLADCFMCATGILEDLDPCEVAFRISHLLYEGPGKGSAACTVSLRRSLGAWGSKYLFVCDMTSQLCQIESKTKHGNVPALPRLGHPPALPSPPCSCSHITGPGHDCSQARRHCQGRQPACSEHRRACWPPRGYSGRRQSTQAHCLWRWVVPTSNTYLKCHEANEKWGNRPAHSIGRWVHCAAGQQTSTLYSTHITAKHNTQSRCSAAHSTHSVRQFTGLCNAALCARRRC